MGQFRVLLVDDEEELVTTIIERLKFRDVDGAYELNGASAIERMRKEPFDIVVLDLKLPGISGEETLRVMKQEHPEIPVLLITGHGSSIMDEKVPRGAAGFLAKPINIDDLLARIKEVLAKNGH